MFSLISLNAIIVLPVGESIVKQCVSEGLNHPVSVKWNNLYSVGNAAREDGLVVMTSTQLDY